jgi:hypothetical protein
MAEIERRSRRYWGIPRVTSKGGMAIIFDDPDDHQDSHEWLRKHAGERVFMQFGSENNDFSLRHLRFWFGVIVARTVESGVWPGYDRDDVHLALKLQYFNIAEPGCPPRIPSFSRSGEAGAALIKQMLPEVIRGLAQIGVVIPERGEYYWPPDKAVIEYDLKKDMV